MPGLSPNTLRVLIRPNRDCLNTRGDPDYDKPTGKLCIAHFGLTGGEPELG